MPRGSIPPKPASIRRLAEKLYHATSWTIREVAADLGVGVNTVTRWWSGLPPVAHRGTQGTPPTDPLAQAQGEISRLQAENDALHLKLHEFGGADPESYSALVARAKASASAKLAGAKLGEVVLALKTFSDLLIQEQAENHDPLARPPWVDELLNELKREETRIFAATTLTDDDLGLIPEDKKVAES